MTEIIIVVGEVTRNTYQSMRHELFKVGIRASIHRCDLLKWRREVTEKIGDLANSTSVAEITSFQMNVEQVFRAAFGFDASLIAGIVVNPESFMQMIDEGHYPNEEVEEMEETDWEDRKIVSLCSHAFCRKIPYLEARGHIRRSGFSEVLL